MGSGKINVDTIKYAVILIEDKLIYIIAVDPLEPSRLKSNSVDDPLSLIKPLDNLLLSSQIISQKYSQ